MIVGWLLFNVGGAIAVAIAGPVTVVMADGVVSVAGALAGTLAGFAAIAVAQIGVAAAGGALVGAVAVAMVARADATKTRIVSIAAVGAGTAVGIIGNHIFSVLLVKGYATASHLSSGMKMLSTNWKRLVFAQDSIRPPDILPDHHLRPRLRGFGVGAYLSKIRERNNSLAIRTSAMGWLAIIFPIGFIYRLSLKSTFWFYWPLVFAQIRVAGITLTPKTLVAEHSKPLFSKSLFGLAVAVVLSPFPGLWTWLDDLLKKTGLGSEQLNLVAQLGDTALLIWPAALASGLLYLSANYLASRAENDELGGWQFDYLKWLIGLRWWLVLSGLVIGLILLAVKHYPGEVPVALVEFSGWVRGRYFGLF